MFIVLLEHAMLYPECFNTKTSTVRCMRWEKSRLYCVAMRTRHTNRCCFARCSNKVKGFSSVSLPLQYFQTAGVRTRSDTMGSCHLEL